MSTADGGADVPLWTFVAAGTSVLMMVLVLIVTRVRQDRRHRRYLTALERLNEIATAISARIDSPTEVLDRLAQAARELLAMDRSGVALLEHQDSELRIVAVAGDVSPEFLRSFCVADLPLCAQVLRSRRPLFIPDVGLSEEALNSGVAELFGARSMVLLPLVNGERKLGLLALSNSQPRAFADEHRRLAQLLASKASVILSNSDLYGRMADALRSQQSLFEQREAIFAVNAAVYQAATLNDSLQMLAELVPGALGVDLCMVMVNGDTDDRARVAAVTKPHGATLIGKSFTHRGTNGEVVRATRRTLVIDDAPAHPGVHPTMRAHLNVGSVAYMPLLRSGGAVMGVLVLIRHAIGPFAPEQLNLAELFTVRAAAAIENAELLEQTRRDAQAKTMLLRELNHRVKNNLASIITLLSLDEPQMSPRAHQWLHRAIDRIRTMARAHDLFAGGMDRVPLSDLVDQTIPSLSVVRPPEVRITSDVTAPVTVGTDRAVSLAMVLHELCYNAIVHGLGAARGSVVIRAHMQAGPPTPLDAPRVKGVLLEVIDDATARRSSAEYAPDRLFDQGGVAVAPAPARADVRPERVGSGGLGLMLVEGLVTRELNGRFSLETSDYETTAKVWFPVSNEDCA